jgi:DNA repair protein RadC
MDKGNSKDKHDDLLNKLDNQKNLIKESLRSVSDMEEIGLHTLDQLKEQTNTIKEINDKDKKINNKINESETILKRINNSGKCTIC